MSKKEFEFITGFSGDNIFQILINDEQETGNKLTEEQYDSVYPEVRNILDYLLIKVEIDLEENTAKIKSIENNNGTIYKEIK